VRRLSNEKLFRALPHARLALAAWRDDYNHHRPHGQLGWLTPTRYAARWTEKQELEERPLGAFGDNRTPAPAGRADNEHNAAADTLLAVDNCASLVSDIAAEASMSAFTIVSTVEESTIE
jgi:hypothetical protein